MYRFLLTPRWLTVSVLALLAVPFCVFMGSWQLSRFHVRVDQHRTAEHDQSRAATEAPVPLRTVLPNPAAQIPDDGSGRLVDATGSYDTGHQFLIPGRALDGHDGFYVLTPLRIGGGAALPVVRGWLSGDASAAARAGSVPAAPTGSVTVTGAVQYPETADTSGVDSRGGLPTGQLGMISAASLVNVLPYPVYSGGWITATHPVAPLKAVPAAAAPNSGLDIKAFQNLGYTGQWFVFAGFVVFMWFRLVRREGEARADAALGLMPDEDDDQGERDSGDGAAQADPDARVPEGDREQAAPASAS
ncbi:SURF1 family protein [Streptomyces sp. V4-01]|uniref:SURF1-like protein n=1 Tax=Actinacidiphila polyblastidii TaxID=3110430 RepID=A0ABU7PHC8_9ACTN|nr:SURF1 family protein [Streptomyces sp. V4-01]